MGVELNNPGRLICNGIKKQAKPFSALMIFNGKYSLDLIWSWDIVTKVLDKFSGSELLAIFLAF